MSLSTEEKRITSQELYANLEASHLTIEAVAEHFNLTPQDITSILNMDSHHTETAIEFNEFIHLVWDVRDYINQSLRQHGLDIQPYSYLKGMKTDYWFL